MGSLIMNLVLIKPIQTLGQTPTMWLQKSVPKLPISSSKMEDLDRESDVYQRLTAADKDQKEENG